MAEENHLWECKPRTKAKLEILNHYLGAWFGILARSGFDHVYYIDGFCGPGEYKNGEEGSPAIAARLANSTAEKYKNFSSTLIFIDKNSKAIKHLQTLEAIKNCHSRTKIVIRKSYFSNEIENILETLRKIQIAQLLALLIPLVLATVHWKKLNNSCTTKAVKYLSISCAVF